MAIIIEVVVSAWRILQSLLKRRQYVIAYFTSVTTPFSPIKASRTPGTSQELLRREAANGILIGRIDGKHEKGALSVFLLWPDLQDRLGSLPEATQQKAEFTHPLQHFQMKRY